MEELMRYGWDASLAGRGIILMYIPRRKTQQTAAGRNSEHAVGRTPQVPAPKTGIQFMTQH
jgi:hypothetical protein